MPRWLASRAAQQRSSGAAAEAGGFLATVEASHTHHCPTHSCPTHLCADRLYFEALQHALWRHLKPGRRRLPRQQVQAHKATRGGHRRCDAALSKPARAGGPTRAREQPGRRAQLQAGRQVK